MDTSVYPHRTQNLGEMHTYDEELGLNFVETLRIFFETPFTGYRILLAVNVNKLLPLHTCILAKDIYLY